MQQWEGGTRGGGEDQSVSSYDAADSQPEASTFHFQIQAIYRSRLWVCNHHYKGIIEKLYGQLSDGGH